MDEQAVTKIAIHVIREGGWIEQVPLCFVDAADAYDSTTTQALVSLIANDTLKAGRYVARYDDTDGFLDVVERGTIERFFVVEKTTIRSGVFA